MWRLKHSAPCRLVATSRLSELDSDSTYVLEKDGYTGASFNRAAVKILGADAGNTTHSHLTTLQSSAATNRTLLRSGY